MSQKLSIVENARSQIDATRQILLTGEQTFSEMVNDHRGVQSIPDLHSYLSACLIAMRNGITYLNENTTPEYLERCAQQQQQQQQQQQEQQHQQPQTQTSPTAQRDPSTSSSPPTSFNAPPMHQQPFSPSATSGFAIPPQQQYYQQSPTNSMPYATAPPPIDHADPLHQHMQQGNAFSGAMGDEHLHPQTFSSTAGYAQSVGFEAQLTGLEEQGETIVVQLVEAPSDSERERIRGEIDSLLQQIDALFVQTQQTPELSQFESRLSRLRSYVQSNLSFAPTDALPSTVTSKAGSDYATRIAHFEESFFALLERANGQVDDQEQLDHTYTDIKQLMRDISAFRQLIQKQAIDASERTRLTDRLEDLQENISDLEHDFGMS
jgi:hypothetical protein